ncbi:MAG: acetyltransferase [Clostridiales bacterium]|nr:acetyltransferase [Clostridiales bacterium]
MNRFQTEKQSGAASHIVGFDGLRALAVIAVFGYHLGLAQVAGGFLGVDLFFVLSGFLITNILLTQFTASGSINIADFWLRRARRLLPALILMLACVTAWVCLLAHGRAALSWMELPAAFLYFSNWYLIFHEVPYFEQFGPHSPFGHLWSLAIEGQFYLLWPVALGLFLRFFKRKQIIALTAAAAAISAAAMMLMYIPGSDPSRVYYGTDTRIFALLAGALAAMLLHGRHLSKELPAKKRVLLEACGISGFLAVLLLIQKTNQYYSFTYQGGLLLFSAAAACLVASIAHPASFLGRLLEAKPLKWIGECSYGIYLWHFPIIVLTSPAVNTNGPNLSLSLVQIILTVALAAVSRYLVEEPIRYGKLGQAIGAPHLPGSWQIGFRGAAIRISAIFFVVLLIPLAAAEESDQLFAYDHLEQLTKLPQVAELAESAEIAKITEAEGFIDAGVPPELTGEEITVIGDSLMVGIGPYLAEQLPGVTVEAKKSRQMEQAPELIASLKQAGLLKQYVVIELGTNGPFTEGQLIKVIDSLAAAEKIIFINTRVPRQWETAVNETFEKVLPPYSNAVLIDWYSASSGHDEYFYDDGVHLKPAGTEAYCALITGALRSQK